MDVYEKSLALHEQLGGKIEITVRAPLETREDLSLAYTPGVARPCKEIEADYAKSFTLTRRGNVVAVVTDGSAVLGLGDIGAAAGMPVMEGKCALFKRFGGILHSSGKFHVQNGIAIYHRNFLALVISNFAIRNAIRIYGDLGLCKLVAQDIPVI